MVKLNAKQQSILWILLNISSKMRHIYKYSFTGLIDQCMNSTAEKTGRNQMVAIGLCSNWSSMANMISSRFNFSFQLSQFIFFNDFK